MTRKPKAKKLTPADKHEWINYFGTETVYGPDGQPLDGGATLFVVSGSLAEAQVLTESVAEPMSVSDMVAAREVLVAPVVYALAA